MKNGIKLVLTLSYSALLMSTVAPAQETTPEMEILRDALTKYRETREIKKVTVTPNGEVQESLVINDENGFLFAQVFDSYRKTGNPNSEPTLRTISDKDAFTLVSFSNQKIATIPKTEKTELSLLDKNFFTTEFCYVDMFPSSRSDLTRFIVSFPQETVKFIKEENIDLNALQYGVIAKSSSSIKTPEVLALIYYINFENLEIHSILPLIKDNPMPLSLENTVVYYSDQSASESLYPHNFERKKFSNYQSARNYVTSN